MRCGECWVVCPMTPVLGVPFTGCTGVRGSMSLSTGDLSRGWLWRVEVVWWVVHSRRTAVVEWSGGGDVVVAWVA